VRHLSEIHVVSPFASTVTPKEFDWAQPLGKSKTSVAERNARSFVLERASSDMGGTPMPRGTGVSPVGSRDRSSKQKAHGAE
jgi:hypothetical protein